MELSEGLKLEIQKTTSPTVHWQIFGLSSANDKVGVVFVIPGQQSDNANPNFTMRYPRRKSKSNPTKHLSGPKIARCTFKSSDSAAPRVGDRRPKHNVLEMTKSQRDRYCWDMDFRLRSEAKTGLLAKAVRWIWGRRDTGLESLYWSPAKSSRNEWKLLPAEWMGRIFGGYHHYDKDVGAEFDGCFLTIDGDLGKNKDFVHRTCLTLVAALWMDEQERNHEDGSGADYKGEFDLC